MSGAKRVIEKEQSLSLCARHFLIENNFIEEALNGQICTQTYSDSDEVKNKANEYFCAHNLDCSFTLEEFQKEIEGILDTAEFTDAYKYDCERIK